MPLWILSEMRVAKRISLKAENHSEATEKYEIEKEAQSKINRRVKRCARPFAYYRNGIILLCCTVQLAVRSEKDKFQFQGNESSL